MAHLEQKADKRKRLQLGTQYAITPGSTILLKDQLSITEQDLANGIALIEHILCRIPLSERPNVYPRGTECHSQLLDWVKAMTSTQAVRTSTRPKTPTSSITSPRGVSKRPRNPGDDFEVSKAKCRQEKQAAHDDCLKSMKTWKPGARKDIRPATTDANPFLTSFTAFFSQYMEGQTSLFTSHLTGTSTSNFTGKTTSRMWWI